MRESVPTENKWFAGYFIAGFIWIFAQSFKKNTIDELIILTIAILAGVFYHRLKSKINVENEAGKITMTFVILCFVSAMLIGFFTAIDWEAIAVRTPLGTEIVDRDRDLLAQINQDQKTYLADFQVRWNAAQNGAGDINSVLTAKQVLLAAKPSPQLQAMEDKYGFTFIPALIGSNEALQKLNDERHNQLIQYYNQVSPILSKHSQNLANSFSQLVKSDEKAKNVYDDIFTAKINYYQAIIDKRPEAEISEKALIVNSAIDKISAAEQGVLQAQQNYQKVYNEFFGS